MAAASGPDIPGGGSIHPINAARFASSNVLCPVAQWAASTEVIASIDDEPGCSFRSAKYVSHSPSNGTDGSTAYSPSVRRSRVERPSSRVNATPDGFATSSCGASVATLRPSITSIDAAKEST